MYRPIYILTLLLFALFSDATASLTLLITGHSSTNVYKHQLARQFVDSYDEIAKEPPSQLSVFTNVITVPVTTDERHLLEIWDDVPLVGNVTTMIVSNLGTGEMPQDQLDLINRFTKTLAPLVVIEFGAAPSPTKTLLQKTSICGLSGRATIAVPNVVYFCNSAQPNALTNLQFENLHDIETPALEKPRVRAILPIIFVSAKVERKHHDHGHHHHHSEHHHHKAAHPYHPHHKHFDEDVEEIVDEIMEEIVEKGAIPPPSTKPVKEPSVQQKKLSCKFRKSCYETGVIPPIDSGLVAFFTKWWPSWEAEEEEVKEEKELGKPFDADEDLMTQKLLCKYRTSCYEERGIPLDEKQEEKRRALFAAKPVPKQPGKKKTLKEIAAIALKKVAEAEEKATKRPVVKVVEKRLNAAEEKRNEKLNCKYRKSCYETGEKPVIEDAWKLPVIAFATESAETVSQEINYDELEELQKKVYCKYRKSCYETGVKPHIEPEIFIKTLADLTTIHEQVETRKLTLQEKCKYRKSCYETGIVPEINPKLEAVIQKEVSSVIPTNAQDLRMLCKYRKSCYAEVHESATVDTIKKIRKRRQIEKEVRRRKARRIKLHRRLRGELQLGSYRSRHRAAQQEAEERSDENVENVAKIIDVKVASAPKKGRKSVKEEELKMEKVSSSQPKAKKAKQQQKVEEEAADEPDSSAIEEETPPVKKQKKAKKSKEQKEEEVKVEKKVEKKSEKKAEKKAEKKEEPKMEKKKEKSKAEKKKEEPKESEKQPPQKTKKESQKTKVAEEEETKDEIEEKEKQEIEKEAAEGCHEKKRFNKAAEAMKKMVEEMHRQQEDLKIREHCKYRKSCYETGQRPVIDQSFHHLLQKFSEHVDREMEQQDSSELPKSEAQKKLECKYRKSCYETGVLPEIKVQVVPTEEQPIVFKAGVSKQLQCKYRKSCYEEAGIIAPKPEVNETEDKRAKLEKKPSQSARPSGDTKRDGGKTEGGAKKQVKLDGAAAASKDAADGKGGDSAQCKPGQSCYSSAPPRAMNEDHAGNMARTGEQRYRESGWCNPYYYSCREILGLPPKERAPIGPNGKRLCRKKPL